ncbi:MAG: glycerate kinase [Clostridiales bacterium]|jgi:hydroxypyruvate reductase|nr:glycerate kinase [Clostridiales bacterium]
MLQAIRDDAKKIIDAIIADNMPQQSVVNALKLHNFGEKVYMVAIGKAAWVMAKTASDFLGGKLAKGLVITKYAHSQGNIPNTEIIEAGHPISDENTILGTQKAIEIAESLGEGDELLFLVSGGGSALFEKPLEGVTLNDIVNINNQLLSSGADIVEINMVRKRLSAVKAGRFAEIASPAHIFSVVLSDVLGDRLDSIASGPAAPDTATNEDVANIVDKYRLTLSGQMKQYLLKETPKQLTNVETVITGSVRTLCSSAFKAAQSLGYTPYFLTSTLNCEASEAGRVLANIATEIQNGTSSFSKPCAIIAGGETVVHLKGNGLGGRNQELALSAAKGISNCGATVLFSIGSDGTDGPTDAAGGIVDSNTLTTLKTKGLNIDKILDNNDAYNGLKAAGGLIITGPTGTNVNDAAILLCR